MGQTLINDLRLAPYRNIVINGNFDMWQRGDDFPSVGNNDFGPDRFAWVAGNTTADIRLFQSTQFPDFTGEDTAEATSSLGIDVDTGDAALDTDTYAAIVTRLEGYDCEEVFKKPFTVSFWAWADVAGTYCFSVGNSSTFGSDRRFFVKEYEMPAGAWTKVRIEIPKIPDADLQWFGRNINTGLQLIWTLAAGSDYHMTEGSWQAQGGFKNSTSNQVNAIATAGQFFRLSQVMLHAGHEDLPFRRAGLSYAGETELCQRYYETSYPLNTAPGTVTNSGALGCEAGNNATDMGVVFKTRKRTSPTVTIYDPSDGDANQWERIGTSNNHSAGSINEGSGGFTISGDTNGEDTQSFRAHYTASAELNA